MLGVELEHALALGHAVGRALGSLLEHLLHLERKWALGGDTSGGIGQARGDGDFLDLVTERLLHSAKEVLVLLGGVLGLLLLVLGRQVKITGRNVLEL